MTVEVAPPNDHPLANISDRLGGPAPFDGMKLGDNREVVETFKNIQEDRTGVGVKLDGLTYRPGRTLTVDREAERFTGEGAQEENVLPTREYRKPFAMPDQV